VCLPSLWSRAYYFLFFSQASERQRGVGGSTIANLRRKATEREPLMGSASWYLQQAHKNQCLANAYTMATQWLSEDSITEENKKSYGGVLDRQTSTP